MTRLIPTSYLRFLCLCLCLFLGAGLLVLPPAAAGPTDDVEEIAALRQRGGLAATGRLCELVREREGQTRVAALRALTAVGLRTRGVSDTLHLATGRDASHAEHAAALEALGRLGDTRDVQQLIDTLKGRDEGLRGVAHAALQKLTGTRQRQDYGAWHRWWRKEMRKKPADVRHAILRLPDAEGAEWERLREVLARDSWTDVAYVENALDDWLSAGDRRLRACAFHTAAVQRLGGVTSAVESALSHVTQLDGEDGLHAARVLGINADVLAPYWRRRFESGD